MSIFTKIKQQAQRDRVFKNAHARISLETRRAELQALAQQADIDLDGRKARKEKSLRAAGFKD